MLAINVPSLTPFIDSIKYDYWNLSINAALYVVQSTVCQVIITRIKGEPKLCTICTAMTFSLQYNLCWDEISPKRVLLWADHDERQSRSTKAMLEVVLLSLLSANNIQLHQQSYCPPKPTHTPCCTLPTHY